MILLPLAPPLKSLHSYILFRFFFSTHSRHRMHRHDSVTFCGVKIIFFSFLLRWQRNQNIYTFIFFASRFADKKIPRTQAHFFMRQKLIARTHRKKNTRHQTADRLCQFFLYTYITIFFLRMFVYK